MTRALITGITGQDGQHLTELLLKMGYDVIGMIAGQNNPRAASFAAQFPTVELVSGDLQDLGSLITVVEAAQPDEVYNLGGMSLPSLSFTQPELTANVNGTGPLRLLEAIRIVGGPSTSTRFLQASSSEMFGKVRETPQRETTPFHPRSPYGCAKAFAHYLTVNYREAYAMFACAAILFNHEGERRGIEFVTRKVTNAVARISLGLQDHVALGTLDTKRDWGYAGDYVEAMWMMLQQPEPDDFVLASGETHSIREFVAQAFLEVGISNWEDYVRRDERFMRPAEVDLLIGDPSKARTKLGWAARVTFPQLVRRMVAHDLALERANVPA